MVTARAAWNPLMPDSFRAVKTTDQSKSSICTVTPCTHLELSPQDVASPRANKTHDWDAFRIHLLPIASVFGESEELLQIGYRLVDFVSLLK